MEMKNDASVYPDAIVRFAVDPHPTSCSLKQVRYAHKRGHFVARYGRYVTQGLALCRGHGRNIGIPCVHSELTSSPRFGDGRSCGQFVAGGSARFLREERTGRERLLRHAWIVAQALGAEV
jgi:hypothetical protein